MLAAPATAAAMPARRTTLASTPPAAKPIISETLETKPSLKPKTPARADPPASAR